MTSKERQYIEWLIDRNDSLRHETAVNYLFYGKERVTTTIRRVVAMFFSDRKYALVREEIYPTFVSVFYQRLIVINPDSLRGIDNLAAYFYRTTKDFLLEDDIRKKIDMSLGIDDTHIELVVEKQSSDDEQDTIQEDRSNVMNEKRKDRIKMEEPGWEEEDGDEEEDDDDDDDDDDGWGRFFLNPYIQRLPEDDRETLISDLRSYITEESAKEYATKVGITPEYVDVRRARAHLELLIVSLPDILKRSKTLFVRFGPQLDSPKRKLLEEFFTTGNFGDKKKQMTIAKAYKTLLKKARSEYRSEKQKYDKEQSRLEDKEEKARNNEKKNSII